MTNEKENEFYKVLCEGLLPHLVYLDYPVLGCKDNKESRVLIEGE